VASKAEINVSRVPAASGNIARKCLMDPVFLFLLVPIAGVFLVFIVAGLISGARRF
jgi:hypothetical protein